MLWKTLDTDSEYEISDTGLVRKVHYHKQWLDKDGYCFTTITVNKKRRNAPVHRLVLHAFDPRPNEDELEVHHIDGNPANNKLENLTWVTHEQNIALIPEGKITPGQFIAKAVVQYDLSGQELNIFPSINVAYKNTGINNRHISEVCQNKRKTAGGFIWKYFEGSTTNSSKCCETESADSEDIVCSSLKNEAVEDTHID